MQSSRDQAVGSETTPPPQPLSSVLTDLAWIPQIKEAHKTLISHLLVCGEHDDVAPKVKATGPDSGVGLEKGQLLSWRGRVWVTLV